jgi:fructose-1,6-bisphosphatase II
MPNAVSVLAAGNSGAIKSFPSFYVDKIAVGPRAKGCIDINDSVKNNLTKVAKAHECKVSDLTATILDRPRHNDIISQVRRMGARIRLLSDGDVAGAIATAMEDSEVNILFGIGGAPEGVLAAAGLKCLGGEIQVRMYAKDDEEKRKLLALGYKEKDFKTIYTTEDLVSGESIIFSATGVTGGYFLPAVTYYGNMAITHSVVMRAKTKTVRYVKAYHHLDIKTIPSRGEGKEVEI